MLSGNTVSQFIPFLLAPILARLFSPVEFAVLANFMALTGVIGIIATGRLELAIPLPERHERAQDLAYTGTVITLVLGLASCVFAFFPDQIGNWYQDELLADYLWLVPPAVISIGLLGLINNWNLRHHKFRILSAGKITQSIVNNLGAALLGYIGWGVEGLIMAWLVSQFANILILSVGVKRRIIRRDFGIDTLTSTISVFRDFTLINSLHAFTDVFVSQFLLYWII
ncbi:MAG: hypothetical protein RL021_1290, partial [Bacteroidota bacterium]